MKTSRLGGSITSICQTHYIDLTILQPEWFRREQFKLPVTRGFYSEPTCSKDNGAYFRNTIS